MKQDQDKTGADPGRKRPDEDGYALTDGPLRRNLGGSADREEPGLLPPLSGRTWNLWEESLLSPNPERRQTALLLLTNPVLNDEPFHYRFLAERWERLAMVWSRTQSPELLGLLLRLAGAWESGPARPLEMLAGMGPGEEIGRVLAGLGGGLGLDRAKGFLPDWIAGEPLGGRGVIPCGLLADLTGLGAGLGREGFRTRWERIAGLARKGEYETACQEAGPGWQRLILETAGPAPAGSDPGRLLAWGGLDRERLSFFESLLEVWAGEVLEVRRICERISAGTGRLVIALFNANRAASLGWGLEERDSEGPLVWPPEERNPGHRPGPGGEELAGQVLVLRRMWRSRRVRPALEKTLAGLSDWHRLNGREREFESLLKSRPETESFRPGEISAHTRPFCLAPGEVLQGRLDRVLGLIDRWERAWGGPLADWLARARSLGSGVGPGEPPRVMGLTEKFSASTRAGEDRGYLLEWLKLLRGTAPQALLLLFDDTGRGRAHLAGALENLPDCLGLGPFGPAPEDDPVSLIISQAKPGRLFALRTRPLRGTRGGLESWLGAPSPDLLRPGLYDPGWRDGLDAILAGTAQEVPAGSSSPWGRTVLGPGGQWPLGSFCREKMRRITEGGPGGPILSGL